MINCRLEAWLARLGFGYDGTCWALVVSANEKFKQISTVLLVWDSFSGNCLCLICCSLVMYLNS